MTRTDASSLYGTLNLLILKILAEGPLHGLAIARCIHAQTEEALSIEEGALYPALHRLKGKGWIRGEWGVSENNRKAKFYQLTDEGREALRSEADSWNRYVSAVGQVLTEAPESNG